MKIQQIIRICILGILVTITSPALANTWQVEKAFKEVKLQGYTRSVKTAVLSAEVTGKLLHLNYDVGDVIGKKKLAQIDPTFVNFQIQATCVALARIKIQAKKIVSRIKYLTREFQRKETLFSKGRTTEVIRDAASQELDQAQLELETIKQEKRSLEVTLAKLGETKARHGVWGPEQWVVTEKKVEEGQVIQAGMPLAVVQDFRQLVVPLAVSNDELGGILEKGETFTAMLENHPVLLGVDYINPEFDEKTRKIRIQLIIPDAGMSHRGGLRLVIPVLFRTQGVKIPVAAVVNRYANPRVFVKGKKKFMGITILDTQPDYLIITQTPGMEPGTMLTLPMEKTP